MRKNLYFADTVLFLFFSMCGEKGESNGISAGSLYLLGFLEIEKASPEGLGTGK